MFRINSDKRDVLLCIDCARERADAQDIGGKTGQCAECERPVVDITRRWSVWHKARAGRIWMHERSYDARSDAKKRAKLTRRIFKGQDVEVEIVDNGEKPNSFGSWEASPPA